MRPDAERQADEGKDKAGKGDRQLLVQLDGHLPQCLILDSPASQFGGKFRTVISVLDFVAGLLSRRAIAARSRRTS